ncbi:MAG: PIG-L family deacetylase [Polyangiaceae bacterium]|nr:PIG-L family deacetylase [Polyangiaceae bacterium]
MTVVALSPHLDDAVLSIPCTLRRLSVAGERVIVLTVFSHGDASYRERRREDREACTTLGIEPLHLGLEDAPFRRGIPLTFDALIHASLGADDPDIARTAEAIAHTLGPLGPSLVFAPLGVGAHIDHRVVHCAARKLPFPLRFYEDRPYALVRHSVAARLFTLGVTDGTCPPPGPEAARELIASASRAPYVRATLPSEGRSTSLERLARPLLMGPGERAPRVSTHRELFHDAELALGVAAMCAYRSQLPGLLGPDPGASLVGDGGEYAETLRKLPPAKP